MGEKAKIDMVFDIVRDNNKLLIEDIKQTTKNTTSISFIKKIVFIIITPILSAATIISLIAAFMQ